MRPAVMALVLLVGAQLQVAPPRDPSSTPAVKPAGTAIIRGRVVAADTGVPIRRALVTISGNGPSSRLPPQTLYTDARGRYEVRELPAGAYLVTARPNQYQAQYLPSVLPRAATGDPLRVALADGQTLDGYDIVLPRAGTILGKLVDENGDPVSGVYVYALLAADRRGTSGHAAVSDEFGRYRLFGLAPDEYLIVARPSGGGDFLPQGQSLGFVETYFPSTHVREEAGRLRVRGGQETTAGDLQLTRMRMLIVSGRVFDSQGAPAGGRTLVTFARGGGGTSMGIGAQGRFSFREPQPPGTYRIIARMSDESGETTLEYGSVAITLVDTDIEDAVVSMKPAISVSGRVVFDGAVPPALSPDALSIRPQARDSSVSTQLFVRAAPVASDLAFTLRRIAGDWLLRPSGQIPAGWSLEAVMLGNTDITDVPTEFKVEDSGRLRLVLTDRAAALSGRVTNDMGEPVRNCRIVLFGEDKSTWFGSSSRFRLGFIGSDGRFMMNGIRPGRYYVIALPLERQIDGQSVDAAQLTALVREATALVVGSDEQRVVDLKLASKEGGL